MNITTTINQNTMSSREIAKLVGSRDAAVNLSIERLVARGVVSVEKTVFANQEMRSGSLTLGRAAKAYGLHRSSLYEAAERGRISTRTNAQGQKVVDLADMDALYGRPDITSPVGKSVGQERVYEYLLNKRNSLVVVAQICPEFMARVVDRWQELEDELAERKAVALPTDYITALEHLLEAKRAEQAAIAERDLAVATKAQIGAKREATAMATASAAARKARQLEQELGRGAMHATITAVENATGRKFGKQGFQPLKAWCKRLDVIAPKAQCPRYGEVRSWPAMAWLEVYGIDLGELFGVEADA